MARACVNEPTLNKGAFVASRSNFTPIQDITKITTPMVRGVMSHYDICAECGIERCIRVEEFSIPASMLGLTTGMPKRH